MPRSNIEVTVRLRPMRPELRETKEAWEVRASSIRELQNPDNRFTFDHIFNTDATTQSIYDSIIRDTIVANVARGYNGTVLAYGQTGSGKSFTMLGGGGAGNTSGIVALAVNDLFRLLEEERRTNGNVRRTEVLLSELEIYNEQLRDLFGGASAGGGPASPARPAPLSIRENEYGVYVHNATRRRVGGAAECLRLIDRLSQQRVSASTAMNEHSSRSHCIICLHVERTVAVEGSSTSGASASSGDDEEEDGDDGLEEEQRSEGRQPRKDGTLTKKLVSTLHLVDLAGSERVAKTGATGVRMTEGGHINKSLSMLTTVINRLTEETNGGAAGRPAFVPYRDSRLTHLLKTAIGGNSFTCVLCCATPAVENVDESRSTLQFASRAKRIHNTVSLNEISDPKARIRGLEIQLHHARRLLLAQTIYLWSKKLHAANLEAQLQQQLPKAGNPPASAAATAATATAAAAASVLDSTHTSAVGGGGGHSDAAAQQQRIIEQLSGENDELRAEVRRLQRLVPLSEAGGGGGAAASGTAPAEEVQRQELQRDVRELERRLEEAHAEQQRLTRALEEIDGIARDLEREGAAQAKRIKTLESANREQEELLDALEREGDGFKAEAELLRGQLQRTQHKLLEQNRAAASGSSNNGGGGGEAAYLEELTRLHVAHQELQLAHKQLEEQREREGKEAQLKARRLAEQLQAAQDEADEAADQFTVATVHLGRLLSACALATTGRVPPSLPPGEPVPEARVLAAVEALSALRSQQQPQQRQGGAGPATDATGADGGYMPTSRQGLLDHIHRLEERLVNKDAQRDIIVDTKLKRMQELAIKLHAMNRVLAAEVEQSGRDYNAVLAAADKYPKVASKLSKAGFFPKEVGVALDRARLAPAPDRPNGHN